MRDHCGVNGILLQYWWHTASQQQILRGEGASYGVKYLLNVCKLLVVVVVVVRGVATLFLSVRTGRERLGRSMGSTRLSSPP